ncbi:MAG TPA: hypothetical protein VIN61_07315 [Gammaproteobacteria bacterium]
MLLERTGRALSFLGIVSLGVVSLDSFAQSAADCDSACLKAFIDGYFDALTRRDPSKLPLGDEVKYTENGRVIELGEGFWKTAGAPHSYRDYLLDPESGGAASLTAFREYDGIAQMFLRLKVEHRRITEIETLVVRVGDQRWFAPENLERMSDVFAQTVPPAQRHTREELIATANAYFTAVHTEGTPEFVQAPFGPGVKRFENGLQTTNVTENPVLERHRLSPEVQLEQALYKGTRVMDRRFPVADVEHGSVLGLATFRREGPDTPTLLLAEIFKVTDGKIREIRAVMLNLPNGAGTGWSGAFTRPGAADGRTSP